MDDLGSTLRRVRRGKGHTQHAASKAIGTSQQNVANYENGRSPRPGEGFQETIEGMAAYLSTNVLEVLRLCYAPWAPDQDSLIKHYEKRLGEQAAEIGRLVESIRILRTHLQLDEGQGNGRADALLDAPPAEIASRFNEWASEHLGDEPTEVA